MRGSVVILEVSRRIAFGTIPDGFNGNAKGVALAVNVVTMVGTVRLPRVRTSGVGTARGIVERSLDRSDVREEMERLSSAIMDGGTALHARHDHP